MEIESVLLAASACMAIAAATIGAAHAQTSKESQPHAYYIAEFRIANPEGMKPYSARVASTFEPYGGRYIVRGGKIAPLEGEGPNNRMVIIEFDSMEKAQAWYDSPEYAQLKPIRHKNAISRVYIVEGTGQPSPDSR
jgi:uncharacterized protein (DUF1330 family)